ncbi:MAG TPA: aldehyde dehydrogenase family protein [Thermoplasmata archaeon]|nr:aldehyde dehydrogenase family protein [Thermoplasmata archaeon]
MSAVDVAYELFIGGAFQPGSRGERSTLLDPATNRPLAEIAVGHSDDAAHAMEVAETAFRSSDWATDDGARRARALFRLAQLLEAQSEAFAELETRNNGKTLRESKGDIAFAIRTLEYVAGLADKVEGATIPVPGARFDYTLREPLGVTVHIAPWNFPLVLALRSVAPALAAGNAVVLKPASLTPLTALRFARLVKDVGVPDGMFNVVVGSGREVGESLIRDPRCRSVSFTGSLEVGRRIAELAAAQLVPATLELGGKSPVVVFPDADLDRAARGIANGIFGNAGQMCWAGSRVIVHASVHAALLEKVRALAENLHLGPGMDAGVEMGPLVSSEQADRVMGYVDGARAEGVQVVTGGARATEPALKEGNFVKPTVLDAVPPDSRVAREEIFGPVLAVSTFETPEEAVAAANASPFGLFAALWTRDLGTAHRMAQKLEAGMVTVNDPPLTFPQSPFAGFKQSGLGFEQGIDSVRAYTRRKNVVVNVAAPRPKK